MSFFQILILIIAALAIAKAVARLVRKEITVIFFILWLIFWLFVAAINVFPIIVNRLADWLGVGRGVDLLIYLSIIAIFYFISQLWLKTKKIENKLSKIVEAGAAANPAKNEIKEHYGKGGSDNR